jgi:serine/threonine-protein kinase
MTQVREGQQALAGGDLKLASKLLKDAFDRSGGHGVPRTLLEHVAVAVTSADKVPCHLTGLARPRTYDLGSPAARAVPAGRPSIALTARGVVVTWTDGHEGPEHAYTAFLDEALRVDAAPVDVTPEGTSVGRPELRRAGDRLVLAYGDAKGAEAGVHARFLDDEGHIAGPSVAVSPVKASSFAPSLVSAANGSVYVAWTDEVDDSEDMFLRRLSASLEPVGDVVRATDLVPAGPGKPRVRSPSLAIGADSLLAVYRMERDPLRLVQQLRVPLAEVKGLAPLKKGEKKADRAIGEVVLVNTDKAKSDGPNIACTATACFVTWYGEGLGGGASAAYLEPMKPQPLWRRKFARLGTHPAIAVAPTGQAQVVWYESGRIFTAPISRDGVGTPTRIARISGEQPTPALTPGKRPGEWYLAWLDYETGHLEAYAARVTCK